jgi:hypothetical protein
MEPEDGNNDVLDGHIMKWFGPDWGAPVCKPEQRCATPEGSCCHCGGKFIPEDRGLLVPYLGGPEDSREEPYHHECFMWCLGLSHNHILVEGVPLCGFMPGHVPGDWPSHHTWVYLPEWRRANCPECRPEGERRQGGET